jgi:predicted DCC family thiol-disulfide oxidoreductase YuxK
MPPSLLIYDGDCPLCSRAVCWLAQRIPDADLRPIPCGSPEHVQFAPQIPETACKEAVHLLLPDGTVHAGADAFPSLLRLMRFGRFPAWIFETRAGKRIAPFFYRWVARRRHALSALMGYHSCDAGKDRGEGGCDR